MDWFHFWIKKLDCRQKAQHWGKNSNSNLNLQLSTEHLYQPMQYMMDLPAKRIRPLLCILAYCSEKNLDTTNENALLDLALSIECLHNFTLAHDDIMDHADKRRGKNALHVEYDQTTAILAGDALFAYSFLILSQSFPEKTKILAPIFSRIALEICEGQAEDIALADENEATIEHYIEMIRKKTAVLLGCALQMGAIAAETTQAEQWYQVGEKLGIAFQLMDDYLDVFGNEQETGKLKAGDILENKKTALWIYAFQHANPEQKNKLIYWQKNHHESKIAEVSAIFKETFADQYVLQLADELSQQAEELIKQLTAQKEGKTQLLELINFLKSRQK